METAQEVKKQLESTALIRFQDCDPFGHLNNARYIDYIFNARQDQVAEHYGVQLFERGQQAGWVVTRMQLAFLAPADMMETVLIRTTLLDATDNSLVVQGVMLDRDARRLKAIIWAEFGYVSLLTGKRTSHPTELMPLFRSVVVEEAFDWNGFDGRVKELKAQYRRPSGDLPQ